MATAQRSQPASAPFAIVSSSRDRSLLSPAQLSTSIRGILTTRTSDLAAPPVATRFAALAKAGPHQDGHEARSPKSASFATPETEIVNGE